WGVFLFFEAEDGIRDWSVTGVQTCALPIYGAFLADGSEFRGDYGLSVRQLLDWHRPRLEALADSGADLLACETIPCQAEAEALRSEERRVGKEGGCRGARHH